MGTMITKWVKCLAIFSLLGSVSACILAPKTTGDFSGQIENAPTQPNPNPENTQPLEMGPGKSGGTDWPSYISSDIPALEGKIRTMFEGLDRIRIFYEYVSPQAYNGWLLSLKERGFSLENVVYVEEGFPDNSEERIKKGDFDAINISKGDYRMTIGFNTTSPVLDIDTSGFKEAAATAVTIVWPEGLAGKVPEPAGCTIIVLDKIPPNGYRITCRIDSSFSPETYFKALQEAGFSQTDIMKLPDGTTLNAAYQMDNQSVMLTFGMVTTFMIEVSEVTDTEAAWPENLTGIVPAPDDCLFTKPFVVDPDNYSLSCQPQTNDAVEVYINKLTANGYTEKNRGETAPGDWFSITFQKENITVRLMKSELAGLLISVQK
jgi:hypothetical protein